MDYDVIILGAGPGGYIAAIRSAQLGLKVACIDKRGLPGGTCLNVGCIPSKALLASTALLSRVAKEGRELGIESDGLRGNLTQMMSRKEKIIAGFHQGILSLFKKHNVTFIAGEASLSSPTTVRVGDKELATKYIVIATGSYPAPLPFLPFDEERILSSTGALSLKEVPKTLTVVGAGVIGVELGSVFSRLGSEVTFIEAGDRVCPTFDESLSKELKIQLEKQGMRFQLGQKVGPEVAQSEKVLVAIGRSPCTQGLGLEGVGITLTPKGFIPVDGSFRTSLPTVFAIGDVIEGPMLAHKASEEGTAVAEILAGKTPTLDYAAIPSVVYTTPEVASVGLTEAQLKELGVGYKVGQASFRNNSRAVASSEAVGFVKVVAGKEGGRLLGLHLIGSHASELIHEGALAIQKRLTASDLANTPHAHPTLAEAIKEAALAC